MATVKALRNTDTAQKADLTDHKARRKRRHGKVHSEEVDSYIPVHPAVIPMPNNKDEYGTLTDDSLYSEYAWAFLRRNRYYQRFIDHKSSDESMGDWGYLGCADRTPSFGLVSKKPYHEKFADGIAVKWQGLHDFYPQGMRRSGPIQSRLTELDWPKSQIAVIFDIGPLLGENATAIDQQISLARIYLREIAKQSGFSSFERVRAPSKALLRAQLRIADLLSAPKDVSIATDSAARGKPAKKTVVDTAIPSKLFTVGDLLDEKLLPLFDLKKFAKGTHVDSTGGIKMANANSGRQKAVLLKRASELAGHAWDNIYNWKFLRWLQFDNWDHLATSTSQPQEKDKR